MGKVNGLEDSIREIGKKIYSMTSTEVPSVFDKNRWIGNAVEWAMKDESFKINLFRFIDVLPSLRNHETIIEILKEYFTHDSEAHGIMKWGIKGLPAKGLISSIAGKAIRQNIETLARQFIAGNNTEDSVKVLESLRQDGLAFGIDILGEVVVSNTEARDYVKRYHDLFSNLHPVITEWPEDSLLDRDDKGEIPILNVSLKVSSLYSQLDPVDWESSIKSSKDNIRELFRRAKNVGASVTFDMEHYYVKDLTIAIFKSILEEEEFSRLPFTGIALQAYLKDSKDDLVKLVRWAKEKKRRISIRLVKGAYWDYEIAVNRQREWPIPLFENKDETDYNYEKLTNILLKNTNHISPAIATHNMRSISNAIATAESLGLPKESYEFQMLFGMAEPIRQAIKNMGYRVRIYTPIGELIPGMSYLVRRLLENTSNESFLKRSFVESESFDQLIVPPKRYRKAVKRQKTGFKNEPPLDFSKAENREKMNKAFDTVKKTLNREYPLFIGDREISKEAKISSWNPSDPQEIIGTVSIAEKSDAEDAIEEAKMAMNEWGKKPPEQRAEFLFKAAEETRKNRFELAALEVYEVGKSWKEADGDIIEAIDYFEYYGQEMIRMGGSKLLGMHQGEVNQYHYHPRGIGVVISPWNFPFAISAGMVSASIVTGNCVLFKPSGLSPVIGWKLMEIFRTVGLPKGVLQYVFGSGEDIGEYLVSHPHIDFIAFTGSKNVGLKIVESAGKTHSGQKSVKKVVAEMGGKNAIIVDETADIDEAVKGILESALGYQGQKCSACSRVIIIGKSYGDLCKRLKEAMDSLNIGPPENPHNFMGPLIDETALKKTQHYMEKGSDFGKEFFSKSIHESGYFAGPAIFTDVDPLSPLAQDEIFGPILSIIKADSVDEAISIVNSSLYALTGGIFSRSPANIEKVKDELKVGNLYINKKITGAIVGRQPFGGFGMSGVGSKAGGPDYLLQFMNPQSISENTMRKGFFPETDS